MEERLILNVCARTHRMEGCCPTTEELHRYLLMRRIMWECGTSDATIADDIHRRRNQQTWLCLMHLLRFVAFSSSILQVTWWRWDWYYIWVHIPPIGLKGRLPVLAICLGLLRQSLHAAYYVWQSAMPQSRSARCAAVERASTSSLNFT